MEKHNFVINKGKSLSELEIKGLNPKIISAVLNGNNLLLTTEGLTADMPEFRDMIQSLMLLEKSKEKPWERITAAELATILIAKGLITEADIK